MNQQELETVQKRCPQITVKKGNLEISTCACRVEFSGTWVILHLQKDVKFLLREVTITERKEEDSWKTRK